MKWDILLWQIKKPEEARIFLCVVGGKGWGHKIICDYMHKVYIHGK